MIGGAGDGERGDRCRRPPSREAAHRLRRLQQLCSRTIGHDELPNALLLIGGADGKFNVYSQALIKYLFLGTTGRDLRNPEFSVENEALEDCVIVITVYDVHVLYSEAALTTVLPIVARWPRCHEYVLPDTDGEDNALFEEHKIRAFRRMVLAAAAPESSFGIPFPRGFEDFRDVEMWPLIQAFALESDDQESVSEGRKFFTMQYKIQDVANALLAVFGSVDALAVEACALRGSVSLATHLAAMRGVLDKTACGLPRLLISEVDLAAPLRLLHDFGAMQDNDEGTPGGCEGSSGRRATSTSPLHTAAPRIQPRVLLGARAAMITDRYAQSCEKHTVGNTGFRDGQGNRSAHHFVVEAEEPSTGLCVCRTHFLATRSVAVANLIGAYRSLCGTLPAVVSAYSCQLGTTEEAKRQAVGAASAVISTLNEVDPSAKWKLDAFIRAIDACRAPALTASGSSAGHDGSHILYIRLTLAGSQGSISVGDSYAILPPESMKGDLRGVRASLKGGKSLTLLLTGSACSTSLSVWGAAEGDEEAEATHLLRSLQDKTELKGHLALGVPLSPDGGGPHEEVLATALFADRVFSAAEGRLRLFSAGLSFRALGCAPVVVSMGSATEGRPTVSVGIVDAPGKLGLMLLVKFFSVTVTSGNPLAAAFPFLESTENFAIPLPSDSSLLPSVLQAFASWKEVGGDKIGHLEASDIPTVMLAALHTSPVLGMLSSSARKREEAIAVAAANLRHQVADANTAQLWAEYRMASKPRRCSSEDSSDTSLASSDEANRGGNSSTEQGLGVFPATILLGLPGSGVLSLAAAVLRFSSGDIDWIPVVFASAGKGIDGSRLQLAIETAIGDARSTSKARVLVVVSAEIGAAAVCTVVTRWKSATRRLKLECCTACIRSMDAKPGQGGAERWRPYLVDQCAAGWTSNVSLVSDRIAETSKAWTHACDLRRWLHLANPGLAFLADCSVQYIGKEALDGILRNDAFELAAMVKARNDSFGSAWAYLCLPGTRSTTTGVSELDHTYRSPTESSPMAAESASLPCVPVSPESTSEVSVSVGTLSCTFRNIGSMDKGRLLACLSTLFPAASVHSAGIAEPVPSSAEEADRRLSLADREGCTKTVSGIRRAGELARAKVQAQSRHAKEAQSLDLILGRWRKERNTHDSRASRRNDRTAPSTASSVAGIVLITWPTSIANKGNIWALLEATSNSVSLSGLPKGKNYQASGGGEVVARACNQAVLDSVGVLLEAACHPDASAKLQTKTRDDMSAAELELLTEEHKTKPLPVGWFFDGSIFIDYEGNRRRERPDMPEIIESYLEAFNRELMI